MEEESGSEDSDDDEIGSLQSAIRSGVDVTTDSPFRFSTVNVNGGSCTGTIIGRRHVLTAAHCNVQPGGWVEFYGGAYPNGLWAGVAAVYQPWGVTNTQLQDTSGKFADFAVIQLSQDIPPAYVPARLSTLWPGNNVSMYQVGVGAHDGYANSLKVMRYRSTLSYSASNADGHVLVEAAADPGDSGGPLFTIGSDGKLVAHGDLYGNVWEWAWHGKYASSAFHFSKIVRALGLGESPNWDYAGNDVAMTPNLTYLDCVAACMAHSYCNAYTFVPPSSPGSSSACWEKSGVGGGGVARPSIMSGIKGFSGGCVTNGADNICRL